MEHLTMVGHTKALMIGKILTPPLGTTLSRLNSSACALLLPET
jgi:hypothetical protein